jgi:ABC-type multidrug transport system permease subunit
MAGLFLFLLLFVIPENFNSKQKEYLYYDVPEDYVEYFEEEILNEDEDGIVENVEFNWKDETYVARLFESEGTKFYVFDDKEVAIGIAEKERAFAGVIQMDDAGKVAYTYYMQGYETQRMLNTLAVFHNEDMDVLADAFDAQEVRVLHEGQQDLLTDRENMIPAFLTFNGSLMGMFILASYIFLDKKEGVIKAYAVTTSPVWQYLLSKTFVVTTTSLISSLVITIPVMGWQPNYPLMVLFLLTSGFAASSLGLVLTSFYEDITQSFGALLLLMMGMILPNVAYFIPSWNPGWMKFIPSYPMLESFKEIILPNGDVGYVLVASIGFLAAGLVLFLIANRRFKKTLTV